MKCVIRNLGRVLAFVLIQSILCTDALAIRSNPPLPTAAPEKISSLISKLGSGGGALIAIRLANRTAVKGYIAEVEPESFLVVDPTTGESNRVAYDQINRMQGVNLDTGVQVSHGFGVRSKLVKVLTVMVPHKQVQGNHIFGTTALLVGIVIGIILAIVLAKAL